MKRPRNNAKGQSTAEQAADYARRLTHQCRKALHQQAKQVRQLSCQKAARQLKNSTGKNEMLERRLHRLKQAPIALVVDEALRRLGLLQMEGRPEQAKSPPLSATNDWNDLIESILGHKRMQDALEKWSAEVTTYRRWCLEHEEKERAGANPDKEPATKRKRKSNKQSDSQNDTMDSSYDYSQSVFLKLGGDDSDDDEEKDDQAASKTKKNRPGQRSRKAKAMAIQAKKEGRSYDSSLNWRTPKKSAEDAKPPPPVPDDAANPSTRHVAPPVDQPEDLHPSWAARKEQKMGILEFKGKKITFD